MKHVRLARCGSTNDEVRQAFAGGEPAPLLVSTAEQTAGRGRLGRSWAQLEGNFAGSFLVEATRSLASAPGIVSLLVGIAVRNALVAHGAESADLALKWPNDVLKREKKVAGVLAEFVEDDRRRAFVIGAGVNLAAAPAESHFPAAAVFAEDAPDAASFGDTLAVKLTALIRRMENEGPHAVLEVWKASAWRFGEPFAVRQGEGTLEGIFEDVDITGRLLLRLPNGTVTPIHAGDAVRR